MYSDGSRGHMYRLIIMHPATTAASPPTNIENTASVLPARSHTGDPELPHQVCVLYSIVFHAA